MRSFQSSAGQEIFQANRILSLRNTLIILT
jgi:hypothetical protein